MNWFLQFGGWSRAFHHWQTHAELNPRSKFEIGTVAVFDCVMVRPKRRKPLRSKTVTIQIPVETWLDLAADYIVGKLSAGKVSR